VRKNKKMKKKRETERERERESVGMYWHGKLVTKSQRLKLRIVLKFNYIRQINVFGALFVDSDTGFETR
jgi:hypothetical protein